MYELFREVGRDLFLAGHVTARHGNLSVRDGDRIYITRSGSMLSRLEPSDIITTRIEPSDRDRGCSRELVVHRAVYLATDATAICHAHPPHTMFRSLVDATGAAAVSSWCTERCIWRQTRLRSATHTRRTRCFDPWWKTASARSTPRRDSSSATPFQSWSLPRRSDRPRRRRCSLTLCSACRLRSFARTDRSR